MSRGFGIMVLARKLILACTSVGGGIYDESGQTVDGSYVFLNWTLDENDIRIRSTHKVSANASGEFRLPDWDPVSMS